MKELVYKFLKIIYPNGKKVNLKNFSLFFPIRYAKYYEEDYEMDSFSYFEKKISKGDIILDIGAHIGLYSIFFSQKTGNNGHVYCFEPTSTTYTVLEDTLRINKITNVSPIKAAISNNTGVVKLNLTTQTGIGSNSNSIVENNSLFFEEVQSYSIDDFILENKISPNVLKIDVEGFEYYALLGARQTFQKHYPFGILALHPSLIKSSNSSLESIYDLLIDYKCNLFYQGNNFSKDWFISQVDLFDIQFETIR